MKKALVITLAVVALALTACVSVKSGTVADKIYREPYQSIINTCASYGTNGQCKIYVPITQHHKECWKVTITDGEHASDWCLSKEKYDTLNVGDTYTVEEN